MRNSVKSLSMVSLLSLAGAGNGEAVAPPPSASNNVFVVNGDSRTMQAAVTSRSYQQQTLTTAINNGYDTKTNGWIAHCLAALKHRIVLPLGGQFAIGSENTADIAARSAQDATQAVNYGAGTVIFLGGTNDSALTVAQSIANYTTIFNAFASRGIRLVVMNELPKDASEAAPANHLARVAWLSDPQRAVDWPGMVQVDTFNGLKQPGTNCTYKTGHTYDGLHPSYAGSKLIGQTVAAAVTSLFPAATFPSLLQLPMPATIGNYLNSNAMMAGTAGTLTTANQPAPTGQVATGWSVTAVSGTQTGLDIQCSKGVSPAGYDEQVIRMVGATALTTARGCVLSTVITPALVNSLAPGTKLRVFGRVRVDAGAIGLFGAAISGFFQGNGLDQADGVFALRRGEVFAGNWQANSASFEMDGTAVDYELMSQDIVIPANWAAAANRQFVLNLRITAQSHSRAVDATTRLSQFGLMVIP